MAPDLNAIVQEQSDAMENLTQAFIRFSMAQARLTQALKDIREDQPTLFSQPKD